MRRIRTHLVCVHVSQLTEQNAGRGSPGVSILHEVVEDGRVTWTFCSLWLLFSLHVTSSLLSGGHSGLCPPPSDLWLQPQGLHPPRVPSHPEQCPDVVGAQQSSWSNLSVSRRVWMKGTPHRHPFCPRDLREMVQVTGGDEGAQSHHLPRPRTCGRACAVASGVEFRMLGWDVVLDYWVAPCHQRVLKGKEGAGRSVRRTVTMAEVRKRRGRGCVLAVGTEEGPRATDMGP